MKVLIVDNESNIRELLCNMLRARFTYITEIQEATGVFSGIEKINSFHPDVVFLDVEMEDGTGFDLLDKLKEISFQLIFITAHNKYAINAFKYSAIDFMQKPFTNDDLNTAMKRATESIKSKDIVEQLKVLKNAISKINHSEQKIVLRDQRSLYFIQINEILRCEADNSYTNFYLTQNRKIIISKTLKEYEELLVPMGFLRTHKSHLVNANKIVRLEKTDGGIVVLDDGSTAPVSLRKWEEICSILEAR